MEHQVELMADQTEYVTSTAGAAAAVDTSELTGVVSSLREKVYLLSLLVLFLNILYTLPA